MHLFRPTAPVWRTVSGLLALVLALTNLGGIAAATTDPITGSYLNHEVGIINATFGKDSLCSLEGWTVTGSVTTLPSGDGDCTALLSAASSKDARAGVTTATLEQSFTVNPVAPKFRLYTTFVSDKPNQTFAAQTITIYNNQGVAIFSAAYNRSWSTLFAIDLSGYKGQSVRLRIAATIDTRLADSPTSVSLHASFGLLGQGPEPEPGPGGGP
ncbi:MAG TPA: hypothetical protein VD886_24145 [Herpetosiphonaceae bacterium]|nr:hypothetical protein [Herpetosiphonaceae bacterium]